MPDSTPGGEPGTTGRYSNRVAAQERRKLNAAHSHLWSGFGLFGLIGWSVAAPTALGGLLGLWIDRKHPGAHSWTLPLLVAGLTVGCATAWHWVAREQQAIHEEDEK